MEEQRNIALETINETLKFLDKKSQEYYIRKLSYSGEYNAQEKSKAGAICEFIEEINKFITDTYFEKTKEL